MALTLCHLVLQVTTLFAEHNMNVFISTCCAQYESTENQRDTFHIEKAIFLNVHEVHKKTETSSLLILNLAILIYYTLIYQQNCT